VRDNVRDVLLRRADAVCLRFDTPLGACGVSGRLYQVEYAMAAISQAGAAVGILSKDGQSMARTRRNRREAVLAAGGAGSECGSVSSRSDLCGSRAHARA
jgi:hypothetical protein